MFQVGMRVRVKDNYAGGLDNVVGQSGKILKTDGEKFLLDLKGSRKASWGNYTYDRNVIALENEIEAVSYEVKDGKGRVIELGDKVAYGPLGGGITIGTVVDIAEREGRYGYKKVKFRLEIDDVAFHSDGGDRDFTSGVIKSYRWYESGSRSLVLSKNPLNDNVFKLTIPTY
jgi:hypothetical protein